MLGERNKLKQQVKESSLSNHVNSGKDPLESICKTWKVIGQIFCHIQADQSDYLTSCLVTSLKASSFSKALFFVLLLTQKWHQFLRIKQPILQHLGSHSPPLFFFHLSLGLIKTASSGSSSFHHCKREADWKANPNTYWNRFLVEAGKTDERHFTVQFSSSCSARLGFNYLRIFQWIIVNTLLLNSGKDAGSTCPAVKQLTCLGRCGGRTNRWSMPSLKPRCSRY